MTAPARFLSAAEAARRVGVSAKALRLYEARGVLTPLRTAAGWRAYGPEHMARAAEIAALRALGFSLAQAGRVLAGDPSDLAPVLAAHQARLEAELGRLADVVRQVERLRADLAGGGRPTVAQLVELAGSPVRPVVAFDLPWPWGGERFKLTELRALTYITGPLGSGKTRLAKRLAETLPGARFLGLDRLDNAADGARGALAADSALQARVMARLAWLSDDGATASDALVALVTALEADGDGPLVVDMIEEGLDEPSQEALIAYLRARGPGARPVLMLTRASGVLDLEALTPHEAVILCPANHSPPRLVEPRVGAPGYEAVETCLAPVDVRARTAGVIAWRPAG